MVVYEGVETFGDGGRYVDEEKRRRLLRQRRGELAMQVAVDLNDGNEQRQA